MIELTIRRQRVLRHIVEEYVLTAQPVASDLIARKYESDVSSATVRNDMAALEEAGLIGQPHTSAGRVPTDQGYRLFVERLMDGTYTLSSNEQRWIREQLDGPAGDPTRSAQAISAVLARLLGSVAVVAVLAAPQARVRRLELVPLHEDLVLVVLLVQSGVVRQAAQRLGEPIDLGDLSRLSNELTERLLGKTAAEAGSLVTRLTGDTRTFALVAAQLLQEVAAQTFAVVYHGGLAELLGQPEFSQSEKLRPILEVLEEETILAGLLTEALGGSGVQVVIGAENALEQMREAALVLTRYGGDEDAGGVIGVLGPTRLPYWRAVPLVQYVAQALGTDEAASPRAS